MHVKKPFSDKSDIEFTAQESKEIWAFTQNEYLDKKEYRERNFDGTIQAVAEDLGLTSKQVRVALSNSSKYLFNQLENTHNKLVQAKKMRYYLLKP